MADTEAKLKNIVHAVESAYERMDFDAIELARFEADDLGLPWYKVEQVISQRVRVPALKEKDLVPLYLVAMIERGMFSAEPTP